MCRNPGASCAWHARHPAGHCSPADCQMRLQTSLDKQTGYRLLCPGRHLMHTTYSPRIFVAYTCMLHAPSTHPNVTWRMMQCSSHLAPMALICTQCCTSSVRNKMAEQRQSTSPACSATCARPGQSNTVSHSTQPLNSTQLSNSHCTHQIPAGAVQYPVTAVHWPQAAPLRPQLSPTQ